MEIFAWGGPFSPAILSCLSCQRAVLLLEVSRAEFHQKWKDGIYVISGH